MSSIPNTKSCRENVVNVKDFEDVDDDLDADESPRNFIKVFEVEAFHFGMDLTTITSEYQLSSPSDQVNSKGSKSRKSFKTIKSIKTVSTINGAAKPISKPGFRRRRTTGIKK